MFSRIVWYTVNMKKGQRTVVKTCGCGCGLSVEPRRNKAGQHKGYNRCLPGHKPPITEKFRAAFEKTRRIRFLPIGSRRQRKDSGYWEIKHQESGKWMLEHRWVVQQAIGRALKTSEHVHHLDGNKSNNSLENLQLLTASEHMSLTGKELARKGLGLHQFSVCSHCGWRHPPH